MLNATKAQIEAALKLHQQQVTNELTKQSVKAHIAGDLKAYKVLKSPAIAFNLVQKEAVAYGKKYGTLLKKEGASIINGKKVAWLAESAKDTRTDVFNIVNEGLRTGKPVDKIGRELRETLIRDKNYEYKRIARTEVARIQSEGSMNRYKDNDVKKVKWLCGGNPCPICQQHCNNIYNINDAPSIPVHPNCTCDKAPVITRAVRETVDKKAVETKKKVEIPKKKVVAPKKEVVKPEKKASIEKKAVPQKEPSKKIASEEKIKAEERASADELWKKTNKDGYEHAKVTTSSRTEYADGAANDSVYIRAPKTPYTSAHTHPDFKFHPEWDCPQSGADIASILKDTNCTRLSASSSKRIFVMNRTKDTKYAPENFTMLKDKFTKTSNEIFNNTVKQYKKKFGKIPDKDKAAKIWRESILEMNKQVAKDYNLDYMVIAR